jgi:hypothetical protein
VVCNWMVNIGYCYGGDTCFFNYESHSQLVLVDFFGLQFKNTFPSCKKYFVIQLFLSTMFFSWNVIGDIVEKKGFSTIEIVSCFGFKSGSRHLLQCKQWYVKS